jgi:hypothetical protein
MGRSVTDKFPEGAHSGEAQISLKDHPRLTYVISVGAKRCLDLRKAGDDAVLKETLKAALDPDDLSASEEVGDYLGAKGIDAIIFRSVVCSGANVVVFRFRSKLCEYGIDAIGAHEIRRRSQRSKETRDLTGAWLANSSRADCVSSIAPDLQ